MVEIYCVLSYNIYNSVEIPCGSKCNEIINDVIITCSMLGGIGKGWFCLRNRWENYMNLEVSAEKLFLEYRNKVFGYIFNRIHNRADAEDLTSEVFAKVVAHIAEYDPEKASCSTWIYVITRNTLIEHFRKQRIIEDIDELQIPVDNEPVDRIVMMEQQEILARALQEIPRKMRDIIVARYYHGFKFAKIAELMSMTEANARVTHARALVKLKSVIEKI